MWVNVWHDPFTIRGPLWKTFVSVRADSRHIYIQSIRSVSYHIIPEPFTLNWFLKWKRSVRTWILISAARSQNRNVSVAVSMETAETKTSSVFLTMGNSIFFHVVSPWYGRCGNRTQNRPSLWFCHFTVSLWEDRQDLNIETSLKLIKNGNKDVKCRPMDEAAMRFPVFKNNRILKSSYRLTLRRRAGGF